MSTDVNHVNSQRIVKVENVVETTVQQAEEMILEAGRTLSEALYEKFSSGNLTTLELHELYGKLTQWTEISKDLLERTS